MDFSHLNSKVLIPPKRNKDFFSTIKGIIQFIQDPIKSFEDSIKDIGDTFIVGYGKNTHYITLNPDHVQHVLQENHKNYTKSAKYDHLKLFLGNGLLTSEGDFWLSQRRTIQPAFYKSKLEAIFNTMKICSNDLINRWNKISAKNSYIEVSEEMIKTTLTIAGKSLFSVDLENTASDVGNAINYSNHFINQRIRRPYNFPIEIPLPSHIKFKKDVKKIDQLIFSILKERMKTKENNNDLLSLLIETQNETDGNSMTEKQLRDELVTLFIAGYETTAVSMSWLIYLLAIHKNYQLKIREEIQQVCNSKQPDYQNYHQLKFTKAAIQEALRLYPPAWIIGRKSIKEDALGEYYLPSDMNVVFLPYFMHRSSQWWEQPDEFYPERFLSENNAMKHKFSYIPFGSGPRLCIGMQFAIMEMTLLIADLVKEFEWNLIENHPKIYPAPLVTLKPQPFIKIALNRI